MKKNPQIPVIVGPTSIGKSAVAMELALHYSAAIVSADSRQVYRYMDIGTAKPTIQDRQWVPHYFIDIVDPDQPYSAGQYGAEGRAKIDDLTSSGRRVIVVGGSGLYVRSLTDGFFDGVGKDEDIRRRIRQRMEEEGIAALYSYLTSVDPVAAARIHPNDAKRIERALEVYELTGRPISELQKGPSPEVRFETLLIGLECDRTVLYQRIEERIDRMLEKGVIEETEDLLRRGYSEKLVSMESLGYREIISYLKGKIRRERMVELFKQGSRNYAKRQLTWFRNDGRVRWFSTDDEREMKAKVLSHCEASGFGESGSFP